ncbi:hypothetical protein ACA910_000611 [Epithemia clementina (nom. ined.)]
MHRLVRLLLNGDPNLSRHICGGTGQPCSQGSLLQTLSFGILCVESDAVAILDQIAGLEVVAIDTDESFSAVYDVSQSFSIANKGNLPVTINSLMTTSAMFPEFGFLAHDRITGRVLLPGKNITLYGGKR